MSKATKKRAPREQTGKEIGEFIRAVRISQGHSLRTFADVMDTNNPYIVALERGDRRYPVEMLKKFTKEQRETALKILTSYLREDLDL